MTVRARVVTPGRKVYRWRIDQPTAAVVLARLTDYARPLHAEALMRILRQTRSRITEAKLSDALNVLVVLGLIRREWDGENIVYSIPPPHEGT